jgi:hypothetical protein
VIELVENQTIKLNNFGIKGFTTKNSKKEELIKKANELIKKAEELKKEADNY